MLSGAKPMRHTPPRWDMLVDLLRPAVSGTAVVSICRSNATSARTVFTIGRSLTHRLLQASEPCSFARRFGSSFTSKEGLQERLSGFTTLSSYIDNAPIGFTDDSISNKMTSSSTISNRTPINGGILGKAQVAPQETVDAAVVSSQNAYQKEWSNWTSKERGEVLFKTATIMESPHVLEELCQIECIDAGIPISQVMDGHIKPAIDCLKYYSCLAMSSSNGMTGTGRVVDTPDAGGHRDSFAYTRREALGVCAGIGPWNYPLTTMVWKLAPALACGNTFIYKPSECTPMSAIRMARILTEAALPPGVCNVVIGNKTTGSQLTQHKLVKKISFTGSTNTGIHISREAASTLKKVTMELGGKSPLLIFEDCNIDCAVGNAIMANFINNGEACSNGTRILVHNDIKDLFIGRFMQRITKMIVGDPSDPATHIGPLIIPPTDQNGHYERVMGFIDRAKLDDSGRVELLCGGEAVNVRITEDSPLNTLNDANSGYYVQPTLFECSSTSHGVELWREEIFGPVACVMGFNTEEEAIALANDTNYGLAAGVVTNDIRRAHRIAKSFEAGTVWINNFNLSPSEAPFGPYKMSGHGKELGTEALDAYTQTKSIYIESGTVDSSWFP